jgi:hypothetical protein
MIPENTCLPPSSVTIGTTSSVLVAENSLRTGLVIILTSAHVVSISFGSEPAVLNKGITLFERGVYVMDKFIFTHVQVNAISNAAGANLAIQEFISNGNN